MLLVTGCARHSQARDDAWAECQAAAIEHIETAEVDEDQRSEWIESRTQVCMRDKGFDQD